MNPTSKKMKIKNSVLAKDFLSSILRICDSPMNDLDLMIRLSDFRDYVYSKVQKYSDLRVKIAEQYCVMEEGKPVVKNGAYTYPDNDKLNETNNLLLELNEKEVELEIFEIEKSVLQNVEGLTPNMVNCLKPMIKN